jgi:dihydrolipoamide dehydrogenase
LLIASRIVVIATGSSATMPPIEGLDSVKAWNNRDGTTSKRIPESMVVLGGGPVGSELAQAWSTLGTRVTLIEGAERLLPREEPFAGEQVATALRESHGVDVRTGALAKRVVQVAAGIRLELDDGSTIETAELLVAVGRRPRTEGIGVEAAGVEPGRGGFLETDARMRVGGLDWLYAVGDVNGRALFTHMGKYQAWVAAENALGRKVEAVAEGLGSPRVTFTDPQVAAAGKTLEQAREAGIDARAVDIPTDSTAGASFQGKETGGTSRIVVDESRQVIVGATFTGFETADFLQAATVAIVGEVPLAKLRHAVAAYPTRSEIWLKLLEAYGI